MTLNVNEAATLKPCPDTEFSKHPAILSGARLQPPVILSGATSFAGERSCEVEGPLHFVKPARTYQRNSTRALCNSCERPVAASATEVIFARSAKITLRSGDICK